MLNPAQHKHWKQEKMYSVSLINDSILSALYGDNIKADEKMEFFPLNVGLFRII